MREIKKNNLIIIYEDLALHYRVFSTGNLGQDLLSEQQQTTRHYTTSNFYEGKGKDFCLAYFDKHF